MARSGVRRRKKPAGARWSAAEKRVSDYEFHVTILHLLGIDHRRLTYYHNGLKRRLTDVHGEVIREILA